MPSLSLSCTCAVNAGRCDLVVFPECFLSGYGNDVAGAGAVASDGEAFARVAAACRAHSLFCAYSFAELAADGKRHIALQLVSPAGESVLVYRKSHLWTPSQFESGNFSAGTQLGPIVELRGVKCAFLVCFDIEVVEPARVLALQGVEAIVCVGANTAALTMTHILPVRAFENGVHVMYCNFPRGTFGCGLSGAFTPCGLALAQAPVDGECDTIFTVRPHDDEFVAVRRRNPFWAVRQPKLYAALALDKQ